MRVANILLTYKNLLIIRISATMKQDAFSRYLYKKKIENKQEVELEISESSNQDNEQKIKPRTKQLKIDQLFKNRIKQKVPNRNTEPKSIGFQHNQPRFSDRHKNKRQQLDKFPEAKEEAWKEIFKSENRIKEQIKRIRQSAVPIYIKNQPNHKKQKQSIEIKSQFLVAKMRQVEQQKRLKRQKRKQQQKKKNQQNLKKKRETFKNFLSNYTEKTDKNGQVQKNMPKSELNNITLFNKMQQQNVQKLLQGDDKKNNNGAIKANIGLTYKKIAMERQKVPISFLKLLLSYKFSSEFPKQQQKRVANYFQDQMTYKKTFHYLVVNECIADLHLRLKNIQQSSPPYIPIILSNFRNNADGFIQFSMSQYSKQAQKQTNEKKEQKQKFTLRNFSLSKNRLGLVTNAKNFRLDHFGIPSSKNERIFGFLCILVTPQSKQQLNAEIKGLTNIETESLDIILKMNKTSKCFFYDLQKISTHIRQYLAISHLYDTQVASFIYKPQLIQKNHLELIEEQQREMMEPILQKLKLSYNNTQYQSIRQMALRSSGLVLLQGPPGTGKTTTLMGLLAAEYEYLTKIRNVDDNRKIMICAPSNAAIDHITKRLVCQGLISTAATGNNFSLDTSQLGNKTSQSDRVFPNILRVGIVETEDPDIKSVSLDQILDNQMMKAKATTIKNNNMTTTQIKQKMGEIQKKINKVKNNKDIQQWEKESQITTLKFQIKKYDNMMFNFRKERIESKQIFNQIQTKLFQEADIILTTLSSSGSEKLEKLRGFIGCLIVDEAAQATEPEILIPLQSGVRKVLLIGDPCQLPSTTMSLDSSITLFNRSLFERFLDNGIKPYFLNIQYRMAPLIRQFPSSTFYSNRLIDADNVIQRYKEVNKNQENNNDNQILHKNPQNSLQNISQFFNRNSIFVDVKFGQQQFSSNSYRNIGQAIVIKNFIIQFMKKTNLSIGIITPYQAQRKYLIRQLKKQMQGNKQLIKKLESESNKKSVGQNGSHNIQNDEQILNKDQIEQQIQQNKQSDRDEQFQEEKGPKKKKKYVQKNKQQDSKSLDELIQQRVMINTVDSFQGQQKDIIIVSTVRSNNRKDIGFMKDQRRINVALTRSKHLLIVVGNGDTIGSNQIWNKYLDWSQNHNCYYQIDERQGIQSAIYKINKGPNTQKIKRIRHTKFSKDLRKQQRQQIKTQDFLGTKGKKRIKRQKSSYFEDKEKASKNNGQLAQQEQKLQNRMQEEENRKNEQLLQQKRMRQQQAINLQEMNKRIAELEQRMKAEGNNPYAKLFQ